MRFFGKYDPLILSIIALITVSLLVVYNLPHSSFNKIIVEIDGKESYVFEKDGTYDIKERGKKIMTIEILEHKVRVLESTCPDKLCVKSGWLKNSSAAIVCVPNRVVIHYEKSNDFKGSGVDTYTW